MDDTLLFSKKSVTAGVTRATPRACQETRVSLRREIRGESCEKSTSNDASAVSHLVGDASHRAVYNRNRRGNYSRGREIGEEIKRRKGSKARRREMKTFHAKG
ncbi:hypothetical protein ALC53_04153 [Atta colombica]|uniref:Uncharacterized protein n=1 Tax=Atta colombica TaxID=520822 RepID=A0A195BMD0_9HYME|nr:hypothetical protein ALC53_04153 [Atta colombica]